MLTFLGGPRACIGYRFALVEYVHPLSFSLFPEYIPVLTIYYLFLPLSVPFFYRMKALLFTLIRAFEFELAVPVEDIGKKSTIVQRPVILSDPAGGNRMPLLLKPVQ